MLTCLQTCKFLFVLYVEIQQNYSLGKMEDPFRSMLLQNTDFGSYIFNKFIRQIYSVILCMYFSGIRYYILHKIYF